MEEVDFQRTWVWTTEERRDLPGIWAAGMLPAPARWHSSSCWNPSGRPQAACCGSPGTWPPISSCWCTDGPWWTPLRWLHSRLPAEHRREQAQLLSTVSRGSWAPWHLPVGPQEVYGFLVKIPNDRTTSWTWSLISPIGSPQVLWNFKWNCQVKISTKYNYPLTRFSCTIDCWDKRDPSRRKRHRRFKTR